MKIEFKGRPLMEIHLRKEEFKEEEIKEIASWLRENSTASSKKGLIDKEGNEIHEFFLWVPGFKLHEKYLTRAYGENIPEAIMQILRGAIELKKANKDTGFILIAIL